MPTLVLLLDRNRPLTGAESETHTNTDSSGSRDEHTERFTTLEIARQLALSVLRGWKVIGHSELSDFHATIEEIRKQNGGERVVAIASQFYGTTPPQFDPPKYSPPVFPRELRKNNEQLRKWLRFILLSTLPDSNAHIRNEDCDHFVTLHQTSVSPWDELFSLLKEIESRTYFEHIKNKSQNNSNITRIQRLPSSDTPSDVTICRQIHAIGEDDEKPIELHWKGVIFEKEVVLKNLTIRRIRIEECVFKKPVLILNCKVLDPSHIERSIFYAHLNIVTTEWKDDLTMDFNEHRGQPGETGIAPWFSRCQFVHRFIFRGAIITTCNSSVINFLFCRCRFEGRVCVIVPDTPTKLSFYACAFKTGRHTEISYPYLPTGEARDRFSLPNLDWDKKPLELRFSHSDLAGRIVVRENPTPTSPELLNTPGNSGLELPYDRNLGIGVNLHGATLSGSLNLRYIRVKWIHCERMTVLGGAIFASRHLFWIPLRVRPRFRSWLYSGDLYAPVLHELVYTRREHPRFSHYILRSCGLIEYRGHGRATKYSILRSISQQYDDLRKAFSNAANSYYQEDFCHYKYMTYNDQANLVSLPHGVRGAWIIIGCSILVMAIAPWVLIRIAALCQSDRQAWLTWIWIASFGLVIASAFHRKFRLQHRYIFCSAGYRYLLGYGVLPARAVIGSIGIIILYAIIYYILPLYANDICGHIHPSAAGGAGMEFVRMLYFSVVTFTTLGYGDNYAVGPLRVIVMSEVFVGALVMALITVTLARQIVRR